MNQSWNPYFRNFQSFQICRLLLLSTLVGSITSLSVVANEQDDDKEPAKPIEIKLSAGSPSSPIAPRYSPPGAGRKLKPIEVDSELGFDALESGVIIGKHEGDPKPIRIVVTRPAEGEAHSRLYIDLNSNGQFDESPIAAKQSESRGMLWLNFEAVLTATYSDEKDIAEDYPVLFWLTVANAEDTPEVIRMSRRGFKFGEFSLDDKPITLIVSDSNNDAILDDNDWWELRETHSSDKMNMRRMNDFLWVGEKAYKVELADAWGSSCNVREFDPGMTREEDEIKRDPFGKDRRAARAEKPLEFRHDVDQALADAADSKTPIFIKFETSWCGPCKTMTELVFTAKEVVDSSEGVLCLKVDGDERKDLVELFSVSGYPTGVMLDAEGEESGRFLGYQSVAAMADFLKDKRVKAEPAKSKEAEPKQAKSIK